MRPLHRAAAAAAWTLAILVAFASPAEAQRYKQGALAIDRNDGERYGWAIDYSSQSEADERALRECGEGCRIVLRFSEGCGAYVVERGNPTLYGWGTHTTRAAAEARARQEARDRGGVDLVLRVWGCNSVDPDRPAQTEAERLAEELAATRAQRVQEEADSLAAERERMRQQLQHIREERERRAQAEEENGRLTGRVMHAVTRNGIGGATVRVSSDAGVWDAVTAADGGFTTGLLPGGEYAVRAEANGFQPATLYGAQVRPTETIDIPSIPLVPASDQPGTISGVVRDARTARPMTNVRLLLRSGVGATAGTPVATTTSGADGSYRFGGLEAGTYSVSASYTDYVDGIITGISVGGSETSNQDVLMSPVGTEHEIRIVLSWGTEPRDLDSHLFGPDGSGGRFRIAYNARGSLTSSPDAALDVDDTSSYGPETVTIVERRPGVYRYAVHHYSGSGSISSSGAVVQVYRGGTLLARFEPLSGASGQGDVWHVFEMQGDSIRQLGVISRSFPN